MKTINYLQDLYKNNRVFRTFLQTFSGYIVANLAFTVEQVSTGGEMWWKVLLTTLIIPAFSTAMSAVMNRNTGDVENVETAENKDIELSALSKAEIISYLVNLGVKNINTKLSKEKLIALIEEMKGGSENG